MIGYLAGEIGGYIPKNPHITRHFASLTAGEFAALGTRLALTQR